MQADYQLDGIGGGAGPPDVHAPEHAAGIALHGPSGWHLQAMGYGAVISDHELLTGTPHFALDTMPTAPRALRGDRELATAASRWIASGAGRNRRGRWVAKLLEAWDALGLRASSIEATVLAGGKAGFVHAEVAFPIKGTKRARFTSISAWCAKPMAGIGRSSRTVRLE